jgi:hypothetical protein
VAFKSQGDTRTLNQAAVYWAPPTDDGHGDKSFATGAEISVRWEDVAKQFVNEFAETKTSRAVVYVDQDVEVGGFLHLGTLAALSADQRSDAYEVVSAYEIRKFDKVGNIAATEFERVAWL